MYDLLFCVWHKNRNIEAVPDVHKAQEQVERSLISRANYQGELAAI